MVLFYLIFCPPSSLVLSFANLQKNRSMIYNCTAEKYENDVRIKIGGKKKRWRVRDVERCMCVRVRWWCMSKMKKIFMMVIITFYLVPIKNDVKTHREYSINIKNRHLVLLEVFFLSHYPIMELNTDTHTQRGKGSFVRDVCKYCGNTACLFVCIQSFLLQLSLFHN